MCGIFGYYKKNGELTEAEKSLSEKMIRAINRRGPDGNGVHFFKQGFFGNVRLAIVDRAHGHQPQYTNNKEFGIVYNGEVYNHQDLRKRLSYQDWKSDSDTEVVLHSFLEWGTRGLSELNGMFAGCIWNEAKNEFWLFRDQMGIKPLYLYEDSERFVFSSELKAFFVIPNIDLEYSPLGLQDYLVYRYIPGPHTLFKKIKKVEPATVIHFCNRGYRTENFKHFQYPIEKVASLEESLEKMDHLLESSVKSQLMGERPVGVLLSGGIDSSTIAYYVHKLNQNLTTFNIGFPDLNEFEYSRAVAKEYKLKHIEISLSLDEMLNSFDEISQAIDEPMSDAACLPLFKLCEELKKHVVVVLSGEGGDELFGGYNQYKDLYRGIEQNIDWQDFMKHSSYFLDVEELLVDQKIPPSHLRTRKYWWGNNPMDAMTNFDLKTWMPDDLMMKADKILMHHSLEGRFPFLDNALLDFSTTLSPELKITDSGVTKYILKKLMENRLPKTVTHRSKMGFSVPIQSILIKMKNQFYESFHLSQKTNMSEIINFNRIEKMMDNFYKGHNENTLRLWTFFSLFYWCSFTQKKYKELAHLNGDYVSKKEESIQIATQ